MKKFRIIEHTADIGIEAYGKNLNELFANASYGMFSIITDISKIKEKEEANFEILENSSEDLLHSWLSELLFKQEVDEMLFKKFYIRVTEYDKILKERNKKKFKLNGKAYGEKFDKKRHHIKAEIKAVTYHQLKIQRYLKNNKHFECKARIIFDV